MSIVIASIGVASARGIGDHSVLDLARPLALGPPSQIRFADRRVAAVPRFDEAARVRQKKSLKLMSRASLLAVAAAREVKLPEGDRAGAGLFLGVGMSGGEIAEAGGLLDECLDAEGALDLAAMGRSGLARLNPLLSFHVLSNMPLCHVSIELGLGGPHAALYAKGAEALHAFDRGAAAVASGEASWALCGGADSQLSTIALALRDGAASSVPSEGAAIALMRSIAEPPPNAIEWIGFVDRDTSVDRVIAVEEVDLAEGAIDLGAALGDTGAASGALAVALAIKLLLQSNLITVGIDFTDGEGARRALVQRVRG